jgi:hypothetical protein
MCLAMNTTSETKLGFNVLAVVFRRQHTQQSVDQEHYEGHPCHNHCLKQTQTITQRPLACPTNTTATVAPILAAFHVAELLQKHATHRQGTNDKVRLPLTRHKKTSGGLWVTFQVQSFTQVTETFVEPFVMLQQPGNGNTTR